mmetsp:Transcript_21192/g.54019  ORF Transcript_21192/g.54019 Transcript_21192/m.54019 type:complete len:478 (+) Transcript_21192:131-1564(+)
MSSQSIKCAGVVVDGEVGQFRANTEKFGWQGESGTVIQEEGASVRAAQWKEGMFRIQLVDEDVLAFDGFDPRDFDKLWSHFQTHYKIHIKKWRPPSALNGDNVDDLLERLEECADAVDDASEGSASKKARELDLLKCVEESRDLINEALSGDKAVLNEIFGTDDCERIGAMRLVLDTVTLENFRKDERWRDLRKACKVVEDVLKGLGVFEAWKPQEGVQTEGMLRRQMMRELNSRNGVEMDSDSEDEQPRRVPGGGKVSALQGQLAGVLNAGVLGGGGGGNAAPPPAEPEPVSPEPAPAPRPKPKVKAAANRNSTSATGLAVACDPLTMLAQQPKAEQEKEEAPRPPPQPARPKNNEKEAEDLEDFIKKDGSDDNLLPPLTGPHIKEGWVWKQSRYLKRWRRRWLILTPSFLATFKDPSDPRPTESLSRAEISSARADPTNQKGFLVMLGGRELQMVCDGETQRNSWVESICRRDGP